MGLDVDQDFQAASDRYGVDDGPVASDDPGFLKPLDPAQARRRGQPDTSGQLDVAQPAIDAIHDRRGDPSTPILALLAAAAARLLTPGQLLLVAFMLFTAALLVRRLLTAKRTARA